MDYIIKNHQQTLYIILDYYYEPEYYQDIVYLYLSCKFFRDYVRTNKERLEGIFYTPKTNIELEIAVCRWCENRLDILEDKGHISKWNTINITDMRCLFAYKDNFNDDISMWITYNVENMRGMFAASNMFNIDISRWNTRNVEDMSYMFWNNEIFCKSINNWNLNNIKYIENIFKKKKLKKLNPNIIDKQKEINKKKHLIKYYKCISIFSCIFITTICSLIIF